MLWRPKSDQEAVVEHDVNVQIYNVYIESKTFITSTEIQGHVE